MVCMKKIEIKKNLNQTTKGFKKVFQVDKKIPEKKAPANKK